VGLAKLAALPLHEIVMGLFRLLLWIAIIFAIVWAWRRLTRPRQAPRETGAQPMVRCAHCGVHIPRDHALSQAQDWYCSQAHLEQGPASRER
jgi:uncharacterized protein